MRENKVNGEKGKRRFRKLRKNKWFFFSVTVTTRCFLRKLGWERGMQSVTGALSLAFFLGLIYKSASLYHPQRRAMLHVKNQRGGKLKEKKTPSKPPRQPWVDLSPLGSRPVRMLMLAAGAAGFGLYTPAFYIVSTLISLPKGKLMVYTKGLLLNLCERGWIILVG